MKCFNHHEMDAIGICKHCAKGICIQCASDLNYGLACKNKHELEVETINRLITRNIKVSSTQKKSTMLTNIIYLLFGLFFLAFGIPTHQDYLTIMGGLFIGYWFYITIYNSYLFKKLDNENNQ